MDNIWLYISVKLWTEPLMAIPIYVDIGISRVIGIEEWDQKHWFELVHSFTALLDEVDKGNVELCKGKIADN